MSKKSSKAPPKGKLSAELLQELGVGIAALAQEALERQEAWETWTRLSAETWVGAYTAGISSGESVQQARHSAADATKVAMTARMQEWASKWYGEKAELVLESLPTTEEFIATATSAVAARASDKTEDLARSLANGSAGMAIVGRVGAASGRFGGAQEVAFAAAASESERWSETIAAAAAWALLKGCSTMNAALAANRVGPIPPEGARLTAETAFVADTQKSLDYVRGVMSATALKVARQAAAERARILADTICRRLGLDATSGRLESAIRLVRLPRNGGGRPGSPPADADAASSFWRELERETRKVLTRSDYLRLARTL